MDALGGETSFADVHAEGVGFVPACTLGVGQKARLTCKIINDQFYY